MYHELRATLEVFRGVMGLKVTRTGVAVVDTQSSRCAQVRTPDKGKVPAWRPDELPRSGSRRPRRHEATRE
jgi:hypothetical protein